MQTVTIPAKPALLSGSAWILTGLLICATAPASGAEERTGGYYVGLQVTGSRAELDDFSSSGTNEFAPIDTKDLVIGAGGVAGYQWRRIPFRTEIEFGYRFRFDFDSRDNIGPISYKNDIATLTVLYNIAYEYRNSTSFTPFIGASIGWARHMASTDRNLQDTPEQVNDENDTDNFAYGGFLGVNWAFADNWGTEVAYRYLRLGEVATGTFSTGDSFAADEYNSHDFLITVKYGF